MLFSKDLYKRKNPKFPTAIEFYLRKIKPGSEIPVWDTIRISQRDLQLLTKLHVDSVVDVVAVDITKYLLPRLLKGDSLYYYAAVSKANFPNPDMPIGLSGYGTTTGSEILAVGYPRKFYDTYNLFPTIKAGIIASKWKAKYEGYNFFLIDCKLFPGSSGSIVISKFSTYGDVDLQTFDRFEFLGVYAGEYLRFEQENVKFDDMIITKKWDFNTGNVWYYYLIEEIISQ